MRIYLGLFTIFLAAVFTASFASAAPTKWKINEYIIIQQAAGESRHSTLEETLLQGERNRGEIPGLTAVQIKQVEKYFADVGEEYQRLGFTEPQIDTVSDGKFEIFVFDYAETVTPARYGPTCGGKILGGFKHSIPDRYIQLDLSRIKKNERITSATYDNIAHEMFHAIQRGYPLFIQDTENGCILGDWITEATAEAIGADIARTLKKVKINEIKMGPRDYSKPLWVQYAKGATQNRAYWTSSLWRYIGEYISYGKSFPPSTQGKRADYRYLQDFFKKKIDTPNEANELKWLDQNLDDSLDINLASLYSNFVTTFAHYVPDRHQGNTQKHHEQIFDDCEKVNLTTFDTSQVIQLDFKTVTARCIEVTIITSRPNAPGIISENLIAADIILGVSSSASSGSSDLRSSLQWAGWKDSFDEIEMVHSRNGAGKLGQNSEESDVVSWAFTNVVTNEPAIFVISNIANNVAGTAHQVDITMEISLAKNTGSWAQN
jgi:hypothetical protein